MKPIITFACIILCINLSVFSQTEITSSIVSGAWTQNNSPYLIRNSIRVEEGKSLIIGPGVSVKFDNGTRLTVSGTSGLLALGNENEPIIFTSNSNSPNPGDWDRIYVTGTEDRVEFSFCIIEYANIGLQFRANMTGCDDFDNSPKINNSIIQNNSNFGMYCVAEGDPERGCIGIGTPTGNLRMNATNNIIRNNNTDGLRILGTDGYFSKGTVEGIFERNLIYDNGGDGVEIEGAFSKTFHFRNNTITFNKEAGIRHSGKIGYQIYNNIISNNIFGIFNSDTLNPTHSYNLYFNNLLTDYQGIDAGENDIQADPQFKDIANRDFNLTCKSEAIDNGFKSLNNDPDGSLPDIGAIPFDHTFETDFDVEYDLSPQPLLASFIGFPNSASGIEIEKYSWEFGDGSSGEGRQIQHIYKRKGAYNVRMIAESESCDTSRVITKSSAVVVQNSHPIILSSDTLKIEIWEDSTSSSIAFSSLFRDPDDDSLIILFENPEIIQPITLRDSFRLKPIHDYFGNTQLALLAKDDEDGISERKIISVFVKAINDAPRFNLPSSIIQMNEDVPDSSISIRNLFTDPENDSMNYMLFSGSNIKANISNGKILLSPKENWFGTDSIIVTATDQNSLSTTNTITIVVISINDPPQSINPNPISFNEDQIDSSYNALTLFSDPDGDTLNFTFLKSEHIDGFVNENGTIWINPLKDWNGSEEIEIIGSDGNAVESIAIRVTILPVNDPPKIISFIPNENEFQTERTDSIDFALIAEDIDSKLTFEWYLSHQIQPNTLAGFSYSFDTIGSYIISAIAKDEEFTSDTINWKINVNPALAIEKIIHEGKINVFPNPFNEHLEIYFDLLKPQSVSIRINDLKGRIIGKEMVRPLKIGKNKINLNVKTNSLPSLAKGIYFINIQFLESNSELSFPILKN